MKTYTLCMLLLCLVYQAEAAFPVIYPNHDSTIRSSRLKYVPKRRPEKKKPFTTLSAYGFLLICASIPAIGIISYATGWFDYTTEWLAVASYIAGLSIISTSLGIALGEGSKARIMLFLSVFFFLVLLIFR